MSESFPAPVYAQTVLTQNFSDAQQHFLQPLLRIHHAHTRMLAKQGIISGAEEKTLLAALAGLDRNKILNARYDGTHEDLFFFVEALLEQACGELAGKMHTARSRNDIAITLYRMTVREELLRSIENVHALRANVLRLAARHLDTVMPAHTHTQPAQPTTLAHYLLAASEFMGRDAMRLQAAFASVNHSPMGAAAITTSGFPIDRFEVARLLGFSGLAENSYGAIAAIDYMTETAAAMAVAMVNLGKFTQDLLLWSTREFGFIRLSDGYVQSSSIMPQKRNPVALEHARILASRAFGEAQAVLTCSHNTPFGDINDSEDDLQPLVFTLFTDTNRALSLLTGVLAKVEVDRGKLQARAGKDFLTVTELADTLVRSEGLSFREAHAIVAAAVKACGTDDSSRAIALAVKRNQPDLKLTIDAMETALDPVNFVNTRTIIGGPAPSRTAEAVENHKADQQRITEWLSAMRTLIGV